MILQQLQDYRQKTGINDIPASPLQQRTIILMEQAKNSLSSYNWTEMSEEESSVTHGHINNLSFMWNLFLILHSDFLHHHKLTLYLSSPHF